MNNTFNPYPTSFYVEQSTMSIARLLLGTILCVRTADFGFLRVKVTETEAYLGEIDLACHASKGRTPRTSILYGQGGVVYVYLIYGMHVLLNLVTRPENEPEAVLLRAGMPTEGLERMKFNYGRAFRLKSGKLCSGPGRLTKALGVTMAFNGRSLTDGVHGDIGIEAGGDVLPDHLIASSPRIGVDYAGEWKNAPLRFYVKNHLSVSSNSFQVKLERKNTSF